MAIEDKEKKIKETPDLILGSGKAKKKYKMDLVPPAVVVSRYFAADQAKVNELEEAHAAASRELEEFIEENRGEESILEDAISEKGTVTKKAVTSQLKVVADDSELEEERQVLQQCLDLMDAEAAAAKAVRAARATLDTATLAKYAELSEGEVKQLVVDDKWVVQIRAAIDGDVRRLTEALAGRIRELEHRYGRTLPQLDAEADELSKKMKEHLLEMGLAWA